MFNDLIFRTYNESFRNVVYLKSSFVPYNPSMSHNLDFNFVANSLWLIIITMTTVGFGEGYPNTHMGRFVGVIACIIGMLLISLMVVSMTIASEFTPPEAKAFSIIKKI